MTTRIDQLRPTLVALAATCWVGAIGLALAGALGLLP